MSFQKNLFTCRFEKISAWCSKKIFWWCCDVLKKILGDDVMFFGKKKSWCCDVFDILCRDVVLFTTNVEKWKKKNIISCLFHEISTFPQIKRNWASWKHLAPNSERRRIDIFDKIGYISGKVFQNLDMCQNFIWENRWVWLLWTCKKWLCAFSSLFTLNKTHILQ